MPPGAIFNVDSIVINCAIKNEINNYNRMDKGLRTQQQGNTYYFNASSSVSRDCIQMFVVD